MYIMGFKMFLVSPVKSSDSDTQSLFRARNAVCIDCNFWSLSDFHSKFDAHVWFCTLEHGYIGM
jgi:hypothetical protein